MPSCCVGPVSCRDKATVMPSCCVGPVSCRDKAAVMPSCCKAASGHLRSRDPRTFAALTGDDGGWACVGWACVALTGDDGGWACVALTGDDGGWASSADWIDTALKKRLAALAIILPLAFLAFAYYGSDGHFDAVSLTFVKSKQAELAQFYEENPVQTVTSYVAIYILVTALAIPGAVPLTLIGGALFGFWLASTLVSLASTIGATLSFLSARYLFRDYVQAKFARELAVVNKHMEKDGAYYLFTARLVPVFPFFLTNLLMGLTPLKTMTYLWVSMPGMLAGTMAYVNAGVELGSIESTRGILTPNLAMAFALVGIAPLVLKKAVDLARHRFR